MSSQDVPSGAPPSRHLGSRVVNRQPNLIRSIGTIRDDVEAISSRVRREEISVAPADWTRGEPATSATMANVLTTRVYRSGHNLYMDLAAGTGAGSIVEAQIAVPSLGLTGPAVQSPAGGTEQDLRVQFAMPEEWLLGEVRRVYLQARRVSGADATTMRVLRAWQR